MPLNESWRRLHAERFSDLPLDCGNVADPGIIYSEDLRDWSDKATTEDQARMERYIDRFDLRDKRILHIGIGNSGLARRFHRRVKDIVGTTIDEPEARVARNLGLPNYSYVLHNKYSGQDDLVEGRFDFILDNNPTSPCCCFRHLVSLFDFYQAKLGEHGQIVTDQQGLEWVPDDSNPRWAFSFDDLERVAQAAGLKAYRAGAYVYLLAREAPERPTAGSLMRHLLRRSLYLAGRLATFGPRLMARAGGRTS